MYEIKKIVFIKQILTGPWTLLIAKGADLVLVHSSSLPVSTISKLTRKKTLRFTSFGIKFFMKIINKYNQIHIPTYAVGLGSFLKYESPDYIFSGEIFEWTTWQCLRYTKKHQTRFNIFSETNDWPRFFISRWILILFVKAIKYNQQYISSIIVWTEQGREWFVKNLPGIPVLLLPAPIETTQFYLDASKEYMPEGVLRIIMNARYIPLKEHRTFFMALQLLDQKGVKFHASLIGRGGYLQDELQKYAKKLDIKQYITWLDQVAMEKLQKIYSSHDVLVLASNREAIGMVVPEAMACGLATVTSEAVGANTYVEEGETGIIFKTGNATALAEALELLSKKEIVQAYGQAAAEVILKEYTVEVLGEKLLKALE